MNDKPLGQTRRPSDSLTIGVSENPMEDEMADESIKLHPIGGWQLATLPEGNVMMELHYVTGSTPPMTTEDLQARLALFRYSMTAEQADELAEVLKRQAKLSRDRRGVAH